METSSNGSKLTAMIENLIRQLENADGPDRNLDAAIALMVGYTRKVENTDAQAGQEARQRVLWIVPSGETVGTVPFYTASAAQAYELVLFFAKNEAGGCSWEGGKASAKIGDGPYCQAATPAIALCIAALRARLRQE